MCVVSTGSFDDDGAGLGFPSSGVLQPTKNGARWLVWPSNPVLHQVFALTRTAGEQRHGEPSRSRVRYTGLVARPPEPARWGIHLEIGSVAGSAVTYFRPSYR